jgi:hypothetical protein
MATPLLTSTLNGGEWAASCPACFIFGKITPGIHWTGGWMGHRAGMDAAQKTKLLPLPYSRSLTELSRVEFILIN